MDGRAHEIWNQIDVDNFGWFKGLLPDMNAISNLKFRNGQVLGEDIRVDEWLILHVAIRQIDDTNPDPKLWAPKYCID